MGLGGITTSGITGSSDGSSIDGLRITGSVTIEGGDSDPAINTYSISASCNVSASAFYGDGGNLTNVSGDARSVAGDTDNAVITWVTSDNTFAAEGNLLFDGSTLTVTGDATVTDDLTLNSDDAIFAMGGDSDVKLTHDGTSGGTLSGTPISVTSVGDLTLSSSTDLVINVDGADVKMYDGAVLVGALQLSSSVFGAGNLVISSSISDKDIVFVGSDGNSQIFPLVIDNSAGGSAKFSNDISLGSDSAILAFGVDNDVTIAHDGTTGATIAGNPLTIDSAGDITLDAAGIGTHVTGALFVSGTVVVAYDHGVAIALPGGRTQRTALEVHHTGTFNPVQLANDTGGGEIVYFGTGSTAAGYVFYLDENGGWDYASSNAVGTKGSGSAGNASLLGIALGTNPLTDGMLIRGYFDANTAWVGHWPTGGIAYVNSGSGGGFSAGGAAGLITSSGPTGASSYVRAVGYCTTVEKVIYFDPDQTWVERS